MSEKKEINWPAVKVDYRTGATLRVLAAKHGVSHVRIGEVAKEGKWPKPTKAAKAKAKTKAKHTEKKVVNKADAVNTVETDFVNPPVNPATKKMGAPTLKTPEVLEAICDAITEGRTVREACNEVGISPRTMWKWLADDADFMHSYTCAKEVCADIFCGESVRISDDRENDIFITADGREIINKEVLGRSKLRAETRLKVAAMLAPKKYGAKALELDNGTQPPVHRIQISFYHGNGERVINPPHLVQIGAGGSD